MKALFFLALAGSVVAMTPCNVDNYLSTTTGGTCAPLTGFQTNGTVATLVTGTPNTCQIASGNGVIVSCAPGYVATSSSSSVTGTCNVMMPVDIFPGAATLTCVQACNVTCTSIGGGSCAYTNGTAINNNAVVFNGAQVQCASGSVPDGTVPVTCANSAAITLRCVGPSSTGANIAAFSTKAGAIAYLQANGIPYESSTVCNVANCVNGVAPACSGNSAFSCSNCYGGCTTVRQGIILNGQGQVIVFCPFATSALIAACFRAADCAGLVPAVATCGLLGVGVCPRCNRSKKGLLGLLGLLGLIPLFLCLYCLCLLLLLCCIRRKKTAREVHFATFDAAAPGIIAPTGACAPIATHAHFGGPVHGTLPVVL